MVYWKRSERPRRGGPASRGNDSGSGSGRRFCDGQGRDCGGNGSSIAASEAAAALVIAPRNLNNTPTAHRTSRATTLWTSALLRTRPTLRPKRLHNCGFCGCCCASHCMISWHLPTPDEHLQSSESVFVHFDASSASSRKFLTGNVGKAGRSPWHDIQVHHEEVNPLPN